MDKGRVTSALDFLRRLHKSGIHAVICGGYVRDTICDKDIRDIDLYVNEEQFNSAYLHLTGTHSFAEYSEETEGYVHQSITRQEEFEMRSEHVGELPTDRINLIGLKHLSGSGLTVEAVIRKFNIGICMAGIELYNNGIVIGDEFRRDYKDKHMTLYRTDWSHEASLKQFIKLHKKYGWPLRVQHDEAGELFDAVQCN